jgi:hypothetical protein
VVALETGAGGSKGGAGGGNEVSVGRKRVLVAPNTSFLS